MVVYNVLMGIVLIFYVISPRINSERLNNSCKILTFALLFFTSAFRFNVGTDYSGYLRVYKSVVAGEYINYGFERGYDFLMYITKVFSYNYQAIFVITSLIIVGLMVISINRMSTNYYFSVFLFISMYFYFNSFNIIRQFMAIAIIVFALRYIEERNIFKFIGLIIIASIFHKTSIIALLLYFLKDIDVSRKQYMIGGCLALVAIPLIPLFMNTLINIFPKYTLYLTFPKASGIGVTSVIILIVFIASMFLKDELIKTNRMNNVYINGVYIALITQFLSKTNIQFIRISMYFYILAIFLIPEIFQVLSVKYKIGEKYERFILSSTIVFFIVWCNYLLISNVGGVIPYQLYF